MKRCCWLMCIFIGMYSCNTAVEQNFTIVNKTGIDMDSVNIFPDTLNYQKLKNGDSIDYKCNMTNVPKVDGNYALNYKEPLTGKLKTYQFGYFTNGTPIETLIRITIYPDSVSAVSVF